MPEVSREFKPLCSLLGTDTIGGMPRARDSWRLLCAIAVAAVGILATAPIGSDSPASAFDREDHSNCGGVRPDILRLKYVNAGGVWSVTEKAAVEAALDSWNRIEDDGGNAFCKRADGDGRN